MTAMLGNGSFTFFDAVNYKLRDIMLVDLWFRTAQELWDNMCRASFRALPKSYQTAIIQHYVDKYSIMSNWRPLDMPNIPGC